MNELFIEPSPSYLWTAWFIYSPSFKDLKGLYEVRVVLKIFPTHWILGFASLGIGEREREGVGGGSKKVVLQFLFFHFYSGFL